MDMQGTPIGSTNQGMKNTTDPRAKDPTTESSGPVASDSLAAESYRQGGGFSDNANAAPSGVSGSNSTFNTTDTSAATKLGPISDATTREAQSAWGDAADLKGAGSSGGSRAGDYGSTGGSAGDADTGSTPSYASAVTSEQGGQPKSAGSARRVGDNSGSGSSAGDIDAGSAPSYVSDVTSEQGGKPKGANLQEGGFEGEANNNDYEIGSDMDPGRAAVQNFQNSNAAAAGGGGPTQRELTGKTTYDTLESDTQA